MITKNRIKEIKALARKKNRIEQGRFVVEGYKSILELAQEGFELEELLVTKDTQKLDHMEPDVVSDKIMDQLSSLKSAPGYLAVFAQAEVIAIPEKESIIALDDLQDPGNLGTIIRLCDWFGFDHIVCSPTTVDLYNPKVVQSSMASIGRVHVHYVADLPSFLQEDNRPVYMADMSGESIYGHPFDQERILVMGSESHGVSDAVRALVDGVIRIPAFGKSTNTESLNVAMATSIILSEWRRQGEQPEK